MATPLDDALVHVVNVLKQDFAAWFTSNEAAKRAFMPNDRPDVLAVTASHPCIVIVRRPQLVNSGLIRTFTSVVDFCAKQEPLAMAEAQKFFTRLEPRGLREPKATLSPRVTSIDEDKYYRVNVIFTIKLRHAEGA